MSILTRRMLTPCHALRYQILHLNTELDYIAATRIDIISSVA